MNDRELTQGSVFRNLLRFSLPYLLSCFLQTFYGLADLYMVGQFNGASAITAVSVGSQLMHMLTVVIVGLAMGSTVFLSRTVGAGDTKTAAKGIGNTVRLFSWTALGLTALLLLGTEGLLRLLSVPAEALRETRSYVRICFSGIVFITAYNVLSSIYRGLGDSRHPMYFVMAAGILNIGLDYVFIGPMGMGAGGAALATVLSQAISVFLAIVWMPKTMKLRLTRQDFAFDRSIFGKLLKNGVPVALQDGLIQVSFLIITMIANRRGVTVAAAVGIVEKVIGFLFLIPSAMLASISALSAQNIGAGQPRRARQTLLCGMCICVAAGIIFSVLCNLFPEWVLGIFAKEEPDVIRLGAQYLRAYVLDCIFAGIHFCFSGYFCACEKPALSFVHNITSIVLVRIPFAWFASIHWPETLYPMGLGAPIGSALSAGMCVCFFLRLKRQENK